ncbi:MAG: saccharopine dehydrogenase NADP-binding domain-containing protein [Phycisphaerales bacterium]|nr:MAG: saccharopine dehydrogenase NADP-binding domain-containing protein [Phycisphaerales bacterium]
MKNVLLLGAGMVAPPLIRYLLENGFALTVASDVPDRAARLIGGHSRGRSVPFDARDKDRLENLVGEHDLAVSLLPAPLHPLVAEACIARRVPMVTTSYVSPEMRRLDEAAREAGIILLNEIGVDPGLDHMSAMRIIHDVESRGGKVSSFKSYCGGLPAPDSNDNPWGYKFSWSPRAVCTAGKNSARWRENGREINIPGPDLFLNHHDVRVEGLGTLEAYPNRDSLAYLDTYDLHEIETMFRGTFRYPGWCDCMKKVVGLGLLGEEPVTYPTGMTLSEWMRTFLTVPDTGDLRADLARQLQLEESSDVLDRFQWLGLMSDDLVAITGRPTTPLDVLAARLEQKMSYQPGERDMIVMCHYFTAKFPDGRTEEITSTLIDYGQPDGDSSMARTVSYPAAIGAKLILEGAITDTGVHIPVRPEIYNPVLDELKTLGIAFSETSRCAGQ